MSDDIYLHLNLVIRITNEELKLLQKYFRKNLGYNSMNFSDPDFLINQFLDEKINELKVKS